MTEEKFERCIVQITEGNKEGLREIYEEYVSYIYGTVYQMLRNRENAEDITSEFFIRLWDKAKYYKPGSGHRGWMATIARNMVIDHIRKYKREELTAFLSDAQDASVVQGNEEISRAVAMETAGSSEGYFRASEVENEVLGKMLIEDAMEELNDKERIVVHLKIMGEMTFKEIAEILEIPMGTVSWRFREAMNKLRRCGYE